MYNLPQNSLALAKGIFYILIGVIITLRTFDYIEGSISTALLTIVAAYFIIYGFFISGFYDKFMGMIKFK